MKTLFKSIGAEVIIPKHPSPLSINLGAKYSPEFICFPFKVNLGDLISGLEKGADTLIWFCGHWTCRFGYYGPLHHKILKNMGYKFESILIGKDGWKDIFWRIKKLNNGNNYKVFRGLYYGIRGAWVKSKLIEKTEEYARKIRPYAVNKREVDEVFNKIIKMIDEEEKIKNLKEIRKIIPSIFGKIKIKKISSPLRVFIVGETYCVLEPIANFDIERKLGNMGVVCEPYFTVHKWLVHPLHLETRGKYGESAARKEAKKYIPYPLGGKDQQSVGFTILSKKRKFDGVIHLQPFGCMPETVAHTVLIKISKKYNIPLLSLSIDEHTAEAGIITRLEAFLDMLRMRRKK
jgi:predicted nucleotide-binding protein (sugar kinase/HSP70/actin superfamily)